MSVKGWMDKQIVVYGFLFQSLLNIGLSLAHPNFPLDHRPLEGRGSLLFSSSAQHCYRVGAFFWMFTSPQNSQVEILTLQRWEGSGAFGRCSPHEGAGPIGKQGPGRPSPLHPPRENPVRRSQRWLGRGPLLHPDLGLPASWTVRNEFLWFLSYAVCGILLRSPNSLRQRVPIDPILPSFVGLLHWSGGLRVGGGATVWPPWNFCSPEWGMQVRVRTVSEERCGRGQKS